MSAIASVLVALLLVVCTSEPLGATPPAENPVEYDRAVAGTWTEEDLVQHFGLPAERYEQTGHASLLFRSRDTGVWAIVADLSPGGDGKPRLDRLTVYYSRPWPAPIVRTFLRLTDPSWESIDLWEGRPCLSLYYDSRKVALVDCKPGPHAPGEVSYVRYFSPNAYEARRREGSTLTGGAIWKELQRLEGRIDPPTTLRNGDFESPLEDAWGPGNWSTGQYRPTSPWTTARDARARAERVTGPARSGRYSLQVVNESAQAPHRYLTTSQLVRVTPKATYVVSFWAKAQDSTAGAFEIVVDRAWKTRLQISPGTYDWRRFELEFTPDEPILELRLLSEDVGTVWVDDLELARK